MNKHAQDVIKSLIKGNLNENEYEEIEQGLNTILKEGISTYGVDLIYDEQCEGASTYQYAITLNPVSIENNELDIDFKTIEVDSNEYDYIDEELEFKLKLEIKEHYVSIREEI